MVQMEYRRVWMIDGAAALAESSLNRIAALIELMEAPEVTVRRETTKMWWRVSPALSVESRLEKNMPLQAAIYTQGYGKALLLGRVIVQPDTMNRYKWMAASAFDFLIDGAVEGVVLAEGGRELKERAEKSTDRS